MTAKEAAVRLELPCDTIYGLIATGQLQARRFSINGKRGTLRITEEALLEFIAQAERDAVRVRPDDSDECEVDPEVARRMKMIPAPEVTETNGARKGA